MDSNPSPLWMEMLMFFHAFLWLKSRNNTNARREKRTTAKTRK